ncbi:hypothetical protein [Robertkochia sediminum]|uniref:hypothetical protein n=1 Tax=Robertkochia sediminum TaxID=2785326 RepID=UPI0019315C05|nr:hypothetical protein [Robertkochia sediminum]MBL7472239.1 hypothetical protein [Robertkochia sediminum]
MKKVLSPVVPLAFFVIVFLLVVLLVFITRTSAFQTNPQILSYGITFDLIVTVPLLYWAMIRKTNIPQITVVPVLILCSLVGSNILPSEHQGVLSLFKTWGLPVAELGFLTYIGLKIKKAVDVFKEESVHSFDFYNTLKTTCTKMLPSAVVMPVATEIAVFYYGFLNWKSRPLTKNEFSYHRDSGTPTILAGIIMLVAVETVTLHHLLASWSIIAANILTGLSIYSGLQLFGFMRAMSKRPISLEKDTLYLRYSIMAEAVIPMEAIDRVELTSRDIDTANGTRKLSPLGTLEPHNVILHFKEDQTVSTLYGMRRRCKRLALCVDAPEAFRECIALHGKP